MGPIFGRNHSQVYPHMRAEFGHDRSSSLAAYTRQTDTHTHNLYYIDIDIVMKCGETPAHNILNACIIMLQKKVVSIVGDLGYIQYTNNLYGEPHILK